jgi:ADP-ribose pyrophosphatase YjhB (NUDIX family)
MKRKIFPVAVHLFLMDKKNILLLKRHNTGYEDGNYSVIAGHLDGNEDVYDAIIREAKEEAGIRILLEDIKIVQVMHRKKMDEERIDYFLLCKKWEGNIRNMELNKCSELRWCPVDDLPNNTIEYIKYAVDGYLNKINFTLFGW